jgi:hypothetical protein
MIQTGQIRGLKVGGQWRILQSRLEELVQEEKNAAPNAGLIACPTVVD